MYYRSFSIIIQQYQLQKYIFNFSKITGKDSIILDKKTENRIENDLPDEINGPKEPEPTRYGDWERKGRISDF